MLDKHFHHLLLSADSVLIDTNILIYATDEKSQFHEAAKELIQKVNKREIQGCLGDKTLQEYYSVLTSKAVGLSKKSALNFFNYYLFNDSFFLLSSTPETIFTLQKLLEKYEVKSGRIYDMYLVALMIENNISTVYTKNIKDFSGIEEISVVDPL